MPLSSVNPDTGTQSVGSDEIRWDKDVLLTLFKFLFRDTQEAETFGCDFEHAVYGNGIAGKNDGFALTFLMFAVLRFAVASSLLVSVITWAFSFVGALASFLSLPLWLIRFFTGLTVIFTTAVSLTIFVSVVSIIVSIIAIIISVVSIVASVTSFDGTETFDSSDFRLLSGLFRRLFWLGLADG